jgi:hypothetical protein
MRRKDREITDIAFIVKVEIESMTGKESNY